MGKSLFLLGQLDDRDIEWMIEYGQREKVPRGRTIIRQGDSIDSLYIVLTGQFLVVDERGGERELARLGSGEIVGEMSFVEAAPPSATVTAAEDCAVLNLPSASLRRKLDGDAVFAARFYRALAMVLSDRLRAATTGTVPSSLEADELDPAVSEAGQRSERILKRLLAD